MHPYGAARPINTKEKEISLALNLISSRAERVNGTLSLAVDDKVWWVAVWESETDVCRNTGTSFLIERL